MSNSQERPWSDNPYAPKIPYGLYFLEKANFAGNLIGSILYGVLIVLFFRCMAALLDPVHRRGRKEGVKWGLVSYTTIQFSFATVFAAMHLSILSDSYINNREFPGVEGVLFPGPIGYQALVYSEALTVIPNLMFLLSNWMADGLLLYRTYIIYSMNLWIIAFPCLLYLASVVMGILLIYRISQPNSSIWSSMAIYFGLPYFSISVSLNILLTLMIVIRLVQQSRSIRAAFGTPSGVGGLYKTTITMLIESSMLYAVSSLLFVGLWGAGNRVAFIFLPIVAGTQVIGPLLIIQRVANRSALTSRIAVAGHAAPFGFGS